MRTSAVIIAAAFIAASPALAAPVRSGPGNGAYVNRPTTGPRDLSEATILLRELPDVEARLYEEFMKRNREPAKHQNSVQVKNPVSSPDAKKGGREPPKHQSSVETKPSGRKARDFDFGLEAREFEEFVKRIKEPAKHQNSVEVKNPLSSPDANKGGREPPKHQSSVETKPSGRKPRELPFDFEARDYEELMARELGLSLDEVL